MAHGLCEGNGPAPDKQFASLGTSLLMGHLPCIYRCSEHASCLCWWLECASLCAPVKQCVSLVAHHAMCGRAPTATAAVAQHYQGTGVNRIECYCEYRHQIMWISALHHSLCTRRHLGCYLTHPETSISSCGPPPPPLASPTYK